MSWRGDPNFPRRKFRATSARRRSRRMPLQWPNDIRPYDRCRWRRQFRLNTFIVHTLFLTLSVKMALLIMFSG